MTDNERNYARAKAANDRMWAHMQSLEPELRTAMVALRGHEGRAVDLARAALHCVMGEVYLRQYELLNIEELAAPGQLR